MKPTYTEMDTSELEEKAELTGISGISDENTFSILNVEREEEFIKLVNIEAPDKDDLGYEQVAVDANLLNFHLKKQKEHE